jgi:hypothetical protein
VYTKSVLAVMLTLAITSMSACSLSEAIKHWNDQSVRVNHPKYGQNEFTGTSCESNGNHCVGCDANKDDCRCTARTTLFVWNER